MTKLKFSAILAAGAVLALSPAHVVAQAAGKQISLGVKIQLGSEGPEIVEMLPDRTGAVIGIKVGDILLEAGGKPISQEVLQAYLKESKEGDQVSFKVRRAGTVIDLTGTAVAAPEGTLPPPAQPQE